MIVRGSKVINEEKEEEMYIHKIRSHICLIKRNI